MKKLFLLLAVMGLLFVSCEEGDVKEPTNDNPIEQPEEDIFELDENSYTIGANGGTVEVVVVTNVEYTVDIPEKAQEWLSVSDTRATRTEKLTFTIEENDSDKKRSATVRLLDVDGNKLASVKFTQKGVTVEEEEDEEDDNKDNGSNDDGNKDDGKDDEKAVFDVDVDGNIIVKAKGGSIDVVVTTNLEYTVEIPAEATWLSLAETRAVRTETLTFAVAKNESEEERSATVKVLNGNGSELLSLVFVQKGRVIVPTNEIWYTSSDGEIVEPNNDTVFGANIVSNTYADGKGVITFDGDVTTIGDYAFYKCSSLTEITIPNSVTTIGKEAFWYCSSLTSVTIPDSVTTIGDYAFEDCSSLTEITIPDSVTTIGYAAFSGCSSLTRVYCKPTTPPAGGLIMFGGATRTIYVPAESVEAYKTAEYWSKYADDIEGYDF